MKIELATGSDDEQRAAAVFESLVAEYAPTIDRFLYTDTVVLDTKSEAPYSHPVLTISPPYVVGPRLVALTVLVHENMHWASRVLPGCAAMRDEARRRWPDPPAAADGGAHNALSTWLHVCVCSLELAAMWNADVYEVVAERGDKILESIASVSDEAAALVEWSRHG